MKAKYVFTVLILLSCIFVFYLSKKNKVKNEYAFMERSGPVSASSEWLNAKSAIEKLLGDLRKNPNDNKTKLKLAMAYIQESRVSGNHGYYDAVALELLDDVLNENPDNYEALCAQATIMLSQHHFDEALEIGNKIIELNSYSAYGYGVLTDAYVELGKYNEAVKAVDKMVSIRPDIRSYSRISYLREIFGDHEGAIAAMKMAVEAGVPGSEQTEWARVYLGQLHEINGSIQEAEFFYLQSLHHRPHYAYAQAGMGRIEKYKKNYTEAIKHFTNAKHSLNDYFFNSELADVYQAMLKSANANNSLKEAISMLSVNAGDESESNHGHYSDKELAALYLKIYQYDLALEHALIEYERRPDNIDINQTLAWVHFRRGEYDQADKHIDKALITKSKNPTLLFQAGLIKSKAGKLNTGKKLLKESLNINSYITAELQWEAHPFLDGEKKIASQ